MVYKPRSVEVRVDERSYEVSIEWHGKSGYATTYVEGVPFGLPTKCDSVAGAKALSEKRIRAYESFLKMR